MLIGYSMPAPTAIALSGGAGYAWLTTDNGSACYDGKPARRSRFRWRNDGSPAIAHTVSITLDIPSTVLRIAAILGLKNVPVGAKVHVYGKRAADGGTTYTFTGDNTGTVREFPDGTRGVWFVLPVAAEAVTKIEFRFLNDNAGATWATAATTIDVGELVAMPAVDVPHMDGWKIETVDPSQSVRTRSSQVAIVQAPQYRVLSAAFVPMDVAKARNAGLANSTDLEKVAHALARGMRGCVIAHHRDVTTKALDPVMVNRTALYGVAVTLPDPANVQRQWSGAEIVFEEIPG